MLLDFSKLAPDLAYAVMIQAIVPRPIAWVLSDNGTGDDGQGKGLNLAPFSFFNGVCGDPPMLMIACSRKPDGTRKDTLVNIEERGEFVVHSVHRELAATMVETSRVLPHGESELTRAGLATTPVEGWPLPRVLGPRLAIWCTRHLIANIGNEPQGLVIGQLLNYPNPFSSTTTIQFEHNRPGEDIDVAVTIVDITGQVVNTMHQEVFSSQFLVTLPEWDGTNRFGAKLNNGVYLLRVSVRSQVDGSKNERLSKIIILN